MQLKVLMPTRVMLSQAVSKVIAEAENGSFCLEPRHVDFTAALVPGLLFYFPIEGTESVLAVDEGILVKCGDEVLVSTRQAVKGRDLETLRRTVEEQFKMLDERERQARTALARLEANFARQLVEITRP